VLADNWFSSKENMAFIKVEMEKNFIMALKSNRTVALSLEDKRQAKAVSSAWTSCRWKKIPSCQSTSKGLPSPGDPGQASLYKQKRKHRFPPSGVERPPAHLAHLREINH
jgi:hypothetical protein